MDQNQSVRISITSFLALGLVLTLSACDNSQAKINFVTKDAPQKDAVAKIGGELITESELKGDAKSDFYELEKRAYDLKMSRLKELMEEKLIGAEAKKANLSTEEFITKKVVGKINITQGEYNKFVKEKGIPEEQLKQHPEYKERINQFLENQKRGDAIEKYLAKLTKNNPVEIYFTKPVLERVTVDIGDAPMIGSKSAKIQMVAFSDFQCPYCAKGAETVHQLVKKYGSKLAVSFKHYPLPFHQQALPAAEVSMCVNKAAGSKSFWKFHDLVFKDQSKMGVDDLLAYAKSAGANAEQVKKCFDAGEFKAAVKADMEYGTKLGVRSTPTFFINGQMVQGALPFDQFVTMIDEELATK